MIPSFFKLPEPGGNLSAADIGLLYHEVQNLFNITAETPLFMHAADGGYHFRLDIDALGQALTNYSYSSTTISSDQNNLDLSTTTISFVNATTNISITGIVAPGAISRPVYIKNTGTGKISFPDESASSTAANRFQNPSNSTYTIGPNQTAGFVYDPTNSRWEPMWSNYYYGDVTYNTVTISVTGTSTVTFNSATTVNFSSSTVNITGTSIWDFGSSTQVTFAGAVIVTGNLYVTSITNNYDYSTVTTNQNNYSITKVFKIINATSAFDITGFVKPTSTSDSSFFFLKNSGTQNITVKHQSGSSSAGNQVYTQDGNDYVIQPHDVAGFIYDQQNDYWEPMWPTSSQAGGSSTPGTQYPYWIKYTKTYTDFSTAGTTNTLTLRTMGAKEVLEAFIIKHSTSFSGGGLLAYSLDMGTTGNNTLYLTAFDVKQATSNTAQNSGSPLSCRDFSSTWPLTVTANSGGANLNAATQGSVDIWVRVATLP